MTFSGLFLLPLVLMLASCNINLGRSFSSISVARFAIAKGPAGVQTYELSVYGSGMDTVRRSYAGDATTVSVEVPSGAAREFVFLAVIGSPAGSFRGSATADMPPGATVNVTISLLPVNLATKIYVANNTDGTVSVINGATNTVSNTLAVGTDPFEIAVNYNTKKVYVANGVDDTVSVIDGLTDAVLTTISDVSFNVPQAIAVNSTTNRIYAVNNWGDSVSVINGATDSVIGTIFLDAGSDADGIGINETTNMIYVSEVNDDVVTVINGATDSVVTEVSVSYWDPHGIAVIESANKIYVAQDYAYIDVINGATNILLPEISYQFGFGWGADANERTGKVYFIETGPPRRFGSRQQHRH